MSESTRWRDVEPAPDFNGGVTSILESADALRQAWEQWVEQASDVEFAQARYRSLRRHAIETGIIERLYDLSWGVTNSLVAEGLTLEAAARADGINEETLDTIRAQYDALAFLTDAVSSGEDLTVYFVRQLHQIITRNQLTYDARDSLGRPVHAQLNHGEWKSYPNHVTRSDGSVLEYTPPEHVQAQMEQLVDLYRKSTGLHPIARAAWLHHRFIRIHPFQDGNGRVARALTLLVLLQARYAPLVVDRSQREQYISALDTANDGDLAPLVRLFARLEIVALRSELENPVVAPTASGAVSIAQAYVQRLVSQRQESNRERAFRVEELAGHLQDRVISYLDATGTALKAAFLTVDPECKATVLHGAPPDTNAQFWRDQLVYTAKRVGFFTNLANGSWWSRLHLRVLGQTLRFIAAVQKSGHGESGALVLTVYAETLAPATAEEGSRAVPIRAFDPTPNDSVTFVYSDDPNDRWEEVTEVLDRTLAVAVDSFARQFV